MQSPSTTLDGPWRHWVVIQPEPPGQFTAQVVGLLELRATAATREEALQQVQTSSPRMARLGPVGADRGGARESVAAIPGAP